LINACSDLSDGGLALAAFEMAAAGATGVTLDDSGMGWLFGEDQARYLIATRDPGALVATARISGLPIAVIGRFGGSDFIAGQDSAPMGELTALWDSAFAASLGLT
jgi:phosphoribosylformylglycinamidine synthase